MHGGTSPGAPKGNQRNLKHGLYSAAFLKERAALRAVLASARNGL